MKKLTEQDLLDLKKKIDRAKTEVSELTGQRNALMKQLREEYNCKSLEEADKELQRMEREVTKLESQIETGMKDLQEKYEWI